MLKSIIFNLFFIFYICVFFFINISYAQNNIHQKLIVIFRYRIEPNYFNNTIKAFLDTLEKRGYIKNYNIKVIDILTDSANITSLSKVYKALNKYKNSADLFVTCGWISIYVRKILKNTKKPQIFVPVLKSVALKLLPNLNKPPKTNITGIYLQYPPEKIIRIAKLIIPNIKNYAYVYDSKIPADTTFKNAFNNLTSKQKLGINIYFFDLSNGIDNVISDIKRKKIGAMGGIVGAFKHINSLNNLKIPLITPLTFDIEENEIPSFIKNYNIIAGLFNPFSYCGFQAGLIAADIFDKKKRIEDIVPRPAKQISFINLKAANKLNIKIPFVAIESTDILIK